MKSCPYCNYSNYENSTVCRNCDSPFGTLGGTVFEIRTQVIGPQRAKPIRSRALCMLVLGLLMKVYWGGYGPWPTVDLPLLVVLRLWLEPLLLYGGAALYVLGWAAVLI
jgi:hypothetical protein